MSADIATTHLHVARSQSDRFDERSLVEAARSDANAFAELYRRHVDRIYSYAFRRSRSPAIAEDVTSATFEKALRGLGSYRWREPGISPWLFRIASNELANYYRGDSRQSRAVESLAATPHLHHTVIEPTDANDDLFRALALIKPRYQQALSLRYFADLSNEEAAVAMGLSRATMAVVVHRSTAALRKAFDQISAGDQVNTHG